VLAGSSFGFVSGRNVRVLEFSSVMQFRKHFSLEEARALLPQLRRIFQDARARRQRIQRADEQLGRLLRQSGADVGGPAVSEMLLDLQQMTAQLQRVEKLGVLIKDVDRGLVDFPHLRDGREVFLCWEMDEDDIEFWHELDTGYAGRERL
jgi:hypothetical protein